MTKRPMPPIWDFDANHPEPYRFAPAPELYDWVQSTILNEDNPLYNQDHEHLVGHDGLAFMWAESGFKRHQVVVHAQTELIAIRDGGWRGLRQQSQLEQWFGVDNLPKAIVTISASAARALDDRSFCALLEHELYHLAQKHNHMGPCFDAGGQPVLVMRGHDSEQFYRVVERYGADDSIATLINAASRRSVADGAIASACGSTKLRLA